MLLFQEKILLYTLYIFNTYFNVLIILPLYILILLNTNLEPHEYILYDLSIINCFTILLCFVLYIMAVNLRYLINTAILTQDEIEYIESIINNTCICINIINICVIAIFGCCIFIRYKLYQNISSVALVNICHIVYTLIMNIFISIIYSIQINDVDN